MQRHGLWHQTKRVCFQALLLPRSFLSSTYCAKQEQQWHHPGRLSVGVSATEPATVVLGQSRLSKKVSCHPQTTCSFLSDPVPRQGPCLSYLCIPKA